MIVLDASAAVEFLVRSDRGYRVRDRVLASPDGLCAPHLLDLEVAQALRRGERSGRIGPHRARAGLSLLGSLGMARWPHYSLLNRIWALRENATAYDAAYLALAERLDVPLVTCDAKLTRVPGHGAVVELIE